MHSLDSSRCLHITARGERCPAAALEDAEFCEAHLTPPEALAESSELPFFFRLLRRTGAALLLAMFLLQLWVGLRILYGY